MPPVMRALFSSILDIVIDLNGQDNMYYYSSGVGGGGDLMRENLVLALRVTRYLENRYWREVFDSFTGPPISGLLRFCAARYSNGHGAFPAPGTPVHGWQLIFQAFRTGKLELVDALTGPGSVIRQCFSQDRFETICSLCRLIKDQKIKLTDPNYLPDTPRKRPISLPTINELVDDQNGRNMEEFSFASVLLSFVDDRISIVPSRDIIDCTTEDFLWCL